MKLFFRAFIIFIKSFNVNLKLNGQLHGASGSCIYPHIYFPHFIYSISFTALFFVSLIFIWTYKVVIPPHQYRFPLRPATTVSMLMRHPAAMVYTVNVLTGSRKQRCLDTAIFLYSFNTLVYLSSFLFLLLMVVRRKWTERLFSLLFSVFVKHNTGNCQNTSM